MVTGGGGFFENIFPHSKCLFVCFLMADDVQFVNYSDVRSSNTMCPSLAVLSSDHSFVGGVARLTVALWEQ